jgi:hypothetical protein
LIDLSNPPVVAEPPPKKETKVEAPKVIDEYNIQKRPEWADASKFFRAISLLLIFLSVVCVFSEKTAMAAPAFFIVGAVGALQCFFFSFLVDVFTDIRWFLKKIAENQLPD